MIDDLNEFIEQSLMKDVDLSPKDYKAKCEKSDAAAKLNGANGEAPLDESARHKRIQLNFYGTVLNFLASILCEISETNRLLAELSGKEMEDGGK